MIKNTDSLENIKKPNEPFDGNACVKEISAIDFRSRFPPYLWYKHIKTEKGATDMTAITILTDIIYHYRTFNKKFAGDMWFKTSRQFAENFELSQSQVSSALKRLEVLGLIIREWRTIFDDEYGLRVPNVQFIAPVPSKIREISMINQNSDSI